MTYRVFKARWWNDAACTDPIDMPRRTRTVRYVETEADAQALCRAFNRDESGKRVRRPYGLAYEYEKA